MSGGKSRTTAAPWALLGGAAVLALCLVAVGLAAGGGEARRGPDQKAAARGGDTGPRGDTSAPAGARSTGRAKRQESPPPEDKAVAGRAVSSYVQKVPEVLSQRRKENQAVVARIGTPVFAEELQANAAYNRANGVRVVGTPKVSRLRVLELNLQGRPPTAVVEACIDNSRVHLVDRRGGTVTQPRQGRSREQFSLVWSGDRWLIDSQGFPDDSDC